MKWQTDPCGQEVKKKTKEYNKPFGSCNEFKPCQQNKILLNTGKNIKQALIERFGHFYRRAPPHESAILFL